MKQYVIDEIRPADFSVLKRYLDEHYRVGGYDGLYRVPLPPEMLIDVQMDHGQCSPHYFALELLPDRLMCELLIRTNNRIRCDCIRYANREQRDWLVALIDTIFQDLGIMT